MQKKNLINIFADENISGLDDLCKGWARLTKKAGREITHDDLLSSDALFVRSVTDVSSALLDGTPVCFVGTATIGVEHIDTHYLQQNNIAFSSAPGSNANAVVDYVMAAIGSLYDIQSIKEKTIGVVGIGSVGSRLCRCLSHFGIEYQVYDPFVFHPHNVDFNTVLGSDIISVHVPLTRTGEHPTYEMFNGAAFKTMADNVLLINSSRGKVFDESALQCVASQRDAMHLVLDVWYNEPCLNLNTLALTSLATPHIAGYSIEGKLRGSHDIVNAARNYFQIKSCTFDAFNTKDSLEQYSSLDKFMSMLFARVNINELSEQFHAALQRSHAVPHLAFDDFRKNYLLRHETCYR